VSCRMLYRLSIGLVIVFLLTACEAGAIPTALPAAATATQTAAPPRILVVCLGEEPESLYPYAKLSASAREILAAVYDGPLDTNAYGYQPVILEKLPSLDDGDAVIESVSMYIGDEIVDADDNPVTLAAGVRVHPSGCRSEACAVTYSGIGEIQMDQLVANFSLLPELTWSDGTPLTAEDSVYSFNLAADAETPGSKYLIERTQSYEAVDELTVQWWGKPGYIDSTYFVNFWTPYPQHSWGEFSAAELPTVDIAAQTPLGWGAYVIEEWVSGNSIRLVRNPRYFRSNEEMPYYDELVFRFTPDPDTALSLLLSGACDALAPSVSLEEHAGLLLAAEAQGILQMEVAGTLTLESLDFGIRPAEYDDGFSLLAGDRPDFFGDPRTRQAVALCLDRQQVVDTVLFGLAEVADSFLPAEHPFYNDQLTGHAYNAPAGSALLEQVGWHDQDGEASTPRLARNVTGVVDGTPLELDYWTVGTPQRRQVSEILAASLAGCGIKVNLQYFNYEDFYAPAPQGVLFGRQFELAEVAMGSEGAEPPCTWHSSREIPDGQNQWSGTNLSGYDDPAYDAACRSAQTAMREEEAYAENLRLVQAMLSDDLPVVPLFWRIKVAAARPGLCNFVLDPTAASDLWNIERYADDASCGE